MNLKRKRKQKFAPAFSLIEIMAVIIIIGLLGAVVAVNIGGRIEKARINTTKASLSTLHDAVISFHMDQGRYPDENQGLLELVEQPTESDYWPEGGYLKSTDVPTDAWKNEFIYERYPESGKPFVIISHGPDGEESEDDLYSTDAD